MGWTRQRCASLAIMEKVEGAGVSDTGRDSAGEAVKEADNLGGATPKGKKPRSPAQQAQFKAAQAARRANQANAAARRAGVDTTAGAGAAPSDLPPGAPKIQTTPHTKAPESPEERARRLAGDPAPDTSDIEPPPPTEQAPAPQRPARSGLLGAIADGLGL